MVLHTFAHTRGNDVPHVGFRTLVTHLLQYTCMHIALKVVALIEEVWVTSFLLAYELVNARIFTSARLLVVHQVSAADEGLLQPSMPERDARIVFTAVLGVSKDPRNSAWR